MVEGKRAQMGGWRGREASPLHLAGARARGQRVAGGGRAAGPSCASQRRARPAPGASGPDPDSRPIRALSQRGRRAVHSLPAPSWGPGCQPPYHARAASLQVPAAADPSPARLYPGGTQQTAVRGRSPRPRSRCRHRPKRRNPWTPKPTQFLISSSYPKILDEMRHDHRAAAAPGSASAPARRCVNTGPAPTAPPPFTATAFFPESSPYPSGRMRHLAAAGTGRTLKAARWAHAPEILFPGFSDLFLSP